jgi:hypothetical protein
MLDLHRASEVRLLPLPRLRHPIPYYCSQHQRCGILPHSRRLTSHPRAPPSRSMEHQAGDPDRHGLNNRKSPSLPEIFKTMLT